MNIFLIESVPFDASHYLHEILRACGLMNADQSTLPDALGHATPGRDVVVLPHGSASDGVEEFVRAGGFVIAIRPDEALASLANLKIGEESEMPSRLRFVHPVCYGTRGEALWTLGPVTHYECDAQSSEPEVLAYSFQPASPTPDNIGIAEYSVGAGRLIVYAYDPAHCIMRLRQGYPERANFLPPEQVTPRAAFLQVPNPPTDTFWRPTADLHARALCEIVKRALELSTPVPTLWHLPNGAPSIVLFSGDEDAAPRENDDDEMRELEACGAAMNLYVIPTETSLQREDVEEFTRRGHTISVHPNISDTAGDAPQSQIAAAENQVRTFREKFDWPVFSVRIHSYMWPGYLDIPELWERLGIGMDCNTTSIMRGDSMEWGPYAKLNAATPLRFVREDGSLIDVFAQPTQLNDDLLLNPTSPRTQKFSLGESEAIMQRLLGDSATFYHAPIGVNFHPSGYASFSGDGARALLKRATAMQLPIWSVDRWHNFWRARASWKMNSAQWNGSELLAQFEGTPCEGLTINLPQQFAAQTLSRVLLNGEVVEVSRAICFGRETAQIAISQNLSSVNIQAEYSGAEGTK
jgi:hypothetical protein